MKRKYRLKRSAKNDFTRLTGIQAIQLTGEFKCLVVEQKTMLLPPKIPRNSKPEKQPIKLVAAYLYLTNGVAVYNHTPISYYLAFDEVVKVKQICGTPECVNPLHLEVTLQEDKRPY